MRSNNALIIPTLGNFELLKNISPYLNRQSFQDFNIIFVIGKNVDPSFFRERMDKLLNLNYEVISQSQSGIIDAMNTVLGLNFRLMVLTDDDAEPSTSYVSNAIDFLEKHEDVGMVFGKVNGVFPDTVKFKFLRGFNSLASRISLFGRSPYRYFNTAGLPSGSYLCPSNNKSVEDYMPIGVCMAWRHDLINDFKLPNYGSHGIFFESYISSALWSKGLTTYFSPRLEVGHMTRESLSRSKSSSLDILREMYLTPKVLYSSGFEIDLEAVKRLLSITKLLPGNSGKVIGKDLKEFLEYARK